MKERNFSGIAKSAIAYVLVIAMLFSFATPVIAQALEAPQTQSLSEQYMAAAEQTWQNIMASLNLTNDDFTDAIYIRTPAELATIGGAQSEGKHYILSNDIELTTAWTPIDDFRGTFDGNGHTINNLHSNVSGVVPIFMGIFGEITSSATIRNVGVNIGTNGVSVSVPESHIGGLVGRISVSNATVVIENSYVTGNIIADSMLGSAGGLIGSVQVGGTSTVTISNCYSTVNISGSVWMAGGLIGTGRNMTLASANLTLENCYAIGNVTAFNEAGGLIGSTSNVAVNSSYRLDTQTVTGNAINTIGEPLTDDEMKDVNSFDGWDFTSLWGFMDGSNNGYPVLLAIELSLEEHEILLIFNFLNEVLEAASEYSDLDITRCIHVNMHIPEFEYKPCEAGCECKCKCAEGCLCVCDCIVSCDCKCECYDGCLCPCENIIAIAPLNAFGNPPTIRHNIRVGRRRMPNATYLEHSQRIRDSFDNIARGLGARVTLNRKVYPNLIAYRLNDETLIYEVDDPILHRRYDVETIMEKFNLTDQHFVFEIIDGRPNRKNEIVRTVQYRRIPPPKMPRPERIIRDQTVELLWGFSNAIFEHMGNNLWSWLLRAATGIQPARVPAPSRLRHHDKYYLGRVIGNAFCTANSVTQMIAGLAAVVAALKGGGAITILTVGGGAAPGVAVSAAGITVGVGVIADGVVGVQGSILALRRDWDNFQFFSSGGSSGFRTVPISNQKMHQLGKHFNKHGRGMGYASKNEYDAAAKLFAKDMQLDPNSVIYEGNWNGSGNTGQLQRAITNGGQTVIINPATGQIIDFYVGNAYGGLINLIRIK